MSTEVKRRRGTIAEHEIFTGGNAEITVNTGDNSLHVHDALTVGGHKIPNGNNNDKRYVAVFPSVENMKSGSTQSGNILQGSLDAVDILVKTQGYYGGWAVMLEPQGDAEYLLTTLQKVRDAKSDPTWTPNGTGDHYLFGGTDYVAMIQGSIANVKQYGAKGGDSTVDTPAFVDAMSSTLPVEVPPINFDNAYVISGEVEIPKQSVMYGTSTLKAPTTDDDARLTEQAYITFEDINSWFWGGSAATDRVGMYWSDLMFISPGGSASKTGTAIGRKTGNANSAMGGNCNRIAFAGFEDGWINDWAYFLDIEGLDLLNNNRGISFDDWNSSSLGTVYGKGGGDYYIDTGGDSARSVIRDFGFNMNSEVKIGIRFEGGVKFSGYGYFEGFGTPTVANQTCIAAAVSPFNNSRPVGLENILFAIADGAYCLTIGGTNDTGNVTWAGTISKCKFNPTQIAPIGYGIHERYNGNPTYPNTTIAGLDLNTCSGITKSDLVGTPYQERPTTLHAFLKSALTGFSPGTSVYERLPIENAHIVTSNYPEIVDTSNRAILRKRTTYEVTCILRLTNDTATEFLCQAGLYLNGGALDSAYELVPAKTGLTPRRTLILKATVENTSSAGQLYVQARNSCDIYSYSLDIKQLYSEV